MATKNTPSVLRGLNAWKRRAHGTDFKAQSWSGVLDPYGQIKIHMLSPQWTLFSTRVMEHSMFPLLPCTENRTDLEQSTWRRVFQNISSAWIIDTTKHPEHIGKKPDKGNFAFAMAHSDFCLSFPGQFSVRRSLPIPASHYQIWGRVWHVTNTIWLQVQGDSDRYLPAILMGCIPVIFPGDEGLPMEEVLDWDSVAIRINPTKLLDLPQVLNSCTIIEIG